MDAIQQINFEGNTIPQSWFQHPRLRTDSGRPNLNAIILLSDIIYWYRPTIKRDEPTGEITEIRCKFKYHRLYKNYALWAEQFGLTKRQVQDAISFLVERGIIIREVTPFTFDNRATVGTVVFLEPIVEMIREITFNVTPLTFKRDPPQPNGGWGYVGTRGGSRFNGRGVTI